MVKTHVSPALPGALRDARACRYPASDAGRQQWHGRDERILCRTRLECGHRMGHSRRWSPASGSEVAEGSTKSNATFTRCRFVLRLLRGCAAPLSVADEGIA